MGRVMAAKAVLPFTHIDSIVPYCHNLLSTIDEVKESNVVHYRLAVVYNLFFSVGELIGNEK